jgi:hypothetical protein
VALMARVKNTPFLVGAAPRTVAADASILQSWYYNVVGDVALVSDIATGENSETPMTHTGAGDGCPLRLPLAAQHLDRSLVLVGTLVPEDDFYVVAVPVFIAAGEGGQFRLTVNVSPVARDAVTAEVLSSAGTVDWGPFPGTREASAGVVVASEAAASGTGSRVGEAVTWSVTLGAGISYILVKRPCYFADNDPFGSLFSWTLDHDRTYAGESNGISAGNGGTAVGSPYKTNASTFTPSTDHDTFDQEIPVAGPLSAYVLTRVNRQINALWEYITGALIPGNAAYQTTTTRDNSRASFTSEGRLDFPMVVAALGACHGDTGKPSINPYNSTTPGNGLIDWSVHPVTRSTTWANLTTLFMTCPSFSTASSALKAVVLIHAPGGAAPNWRFRVNSGASVAATQVGTTNFFAATITAITFTASADNTFNVQISNTTTAALADAIDVLGVALYYDP